MNSIEIIHAPREIGQTWHAEQRSILGGSKLIEQTFNSPCCSIASGLCLVTNRKTLILNKIKIMVKFLDGATESHWVGLSEAFTLV